MTVAPFHHRRYAAAARTDGAVGFSPRGRALIALHVSSACGAFDGHLPRIGGV
jgi:hypothetical protein